MSDKLNQLENRVFLLEGITTELARILMQTATPDQLDQLYFLQQHVEEVHRKWESNDN